jgi:acyl carrier protein
MKSNEERFRDIVASILGLAPQAVTNDLTADAVDTWDSLNHISLIGALEQEFNIRLPAENLIESQSIAQLRALLSQHGVEFQDRS